MKASIKNFGTIASVVMFFAIGLLFGLFSYTPIVSGVNNTSVFVTVNISNTPPSVYDVVVNPNPVELSPGVTTTVNCTAFIFDFNGYDDIQYVNATLFRNDTTTVNANDDNNNKYTNSSCQACTQHNGGAENGSCTCLFSVEYYADNSTDWQCNVSIYDDTFLNASNVTGFSVSPLLAINTSSVLDYGDLVVFGTSDPQPVNITNLGNVDVNLSFRSHGHVDDTPYYRNQTLVCSTNNISFEQQRWSINATQQFDEMSPVSNQSLTIGNLTVVQRTNDTALGFDFNATYFRLRIPESVAGQCNGTLLFQAEAAT